MGNCTTQTQSLEQSWSRETLEQIYRDTLVELEAFADGYGQMFKLSALYEAALRGIKQTAQRTDIPAGDALYLVCVQAEKALEHALPREEGNGDDE